MGDSNIIKTLNQLIKFFNESEITATEFAKFSVNNEKKITRGADFDEKKLHAKTLYLKFKVLYDSGQGVPGGRSVILRTLQRYELCMQKVEGQLRENINTLVIAQKHELSMLKRSLDYIQTLHSNLKQFSPENSILGDTSTDIHKIETGYAILKHVPITYSGAFLAKLVDLKRIAVELNNQIEKLSSQIKLQIPINTVTNQTVNKDSGTLTPIDKTMVESRAIVLTRICQIVQEAEHAIVALKGRTKELKDQYHKLAKIEKNGKVSLDCDEGSHEILTVSEYTGDIISPLVDRGRLEENLLKNLLVEYRYLLRKIPASTESVSTFPTFKMNSAINNFNHIVNNGLQAIRNEGQLTVTAANSSLLKGRSGVKRSVGDDTSSISFLIPLSPSGRKTP